PYFFQICRYRRSCSACPSTCFPARRPPERQRNILRTLREQQRNINSSGNDRGSPGGLLIWRIGDIYSMSLVFLKQDNPARNSSFYASQALKNQADGHFLLQKLWFRAASPDIIRTQASARKTPRGIFPPICRQELLSSRRRITNIRFRVRRGLGNS